MKLCTVDGCETPARGKLEFCPKHQQRFLKYGDPLFVKQVRTTDLADALSKKTAWEGECLLWVGARTSAGYGSYGGKEKAEFGTQYVHRLVWMQEHGFIPPEVEIDHMCWNRACCLLEHLREVNRTANCQNQNPAGRKVKGTGVLGVTLVKKTGKYMGMIYRKRKAIYVGTFNTLDEAAAAVEMARREFYTTNPLKEAA